MERAQRQRLIALARGAGLLPALDAIRYFRSTRQNAAANRKFLAEHQEFAPPPLRWMYDMYAGTSFSQYWGMGMQTAAVIAGKIDAHVEAGAPRVADWGCGLARVIRHLPERYRRTGFDYNLHAINWCKEEIEGVEFYHNNLMPPLPAAAASFDALYALSVFTHLSEAAHDAWIGEIERVLAPGGVFLGAFHMVPPAGQLLPDEQSRFEAGQLVVRGGVKEGSRTYTAHHPEPYLREKLLVNFDIIEPPIDLFAQTLFVARKR